jgi:two-component system NtrC family sensor kinase
VTDDMHQAIERIERIVQGLVDYARPGLNGRSVQKSASIDLNAAVRTVLDFLGSQGMLREHALELSLEPDLPRVSGNQHLLEQVVINLVVNACQASPGGRLAIGTRAKVLGSSSRRTAVRHNDGGSRAPDPSRSWSPEPRPLELPPGTRGAMLFVADEGPGVSEADRERVFDPFFTTKEPGQGTGLGLAIVARTVHECGGSVWVDRAREGGAVFKVFLPTAGETDAAAHR